MSTFFSDLWNEAAKADCPAIHAVMMMGNAPKQTCPDDLLTLVAVADKMVDAGDDFYNAIEPIYARQSPKLERGFYVCPACGRESCGGARIHFRELPPNIAELLK